VAAGPVGTHVLLLRGVNVGGHNRVPMADLRALLAALGCEDVTTYLQSGNAVCRSTAVPGRLASDLEAALAAELGVTVRVLVRTAAEVAAAVAANPLEASTDDPKRLHVLFLETAPDGGRVDALVAEAADLAPERLGVSGAEAYLFTPAGYHDARLTGAFVERRLGRVGTARNWRTVLALADLAGGA
jgi:uncharacterized protein (DUF1697 family)